MTNNLLVNPSFEQAGGWTLGGTTGNITLQSATITPRLGAFCCKVIEVSGNCYVYQDITVTPGTLYVVSAYVNITNWSAGGMYLKMSDTSFNTYVAVTSDQNNLAWTLITASYTADPGVTTIRVILDTFNAATFTGYWDNVLFGPASNTPTNISRYISVGNGMSRSESAT